MTMNVVHKTKTTALLKGVMSAAASLMVLAACTDSYPTLIHNDGSTIGNDEVYDRVPLMMFVNEQDYFSIIATRGTGVFDDEHAGKLANSLFYVYAFRAAEDADGNIVHNTDYRETSSGGTASDQDRLTAADCLLDGADYNFGMPTKLTADRNGTLEPQTTQKLYFSSAFQDVGYDFFVYHIDDFEPTAANTHREADRIYYDLEIDGSQDIMSGMAPKLTRDVLDEKIRDGKLTITKSDQEQILDIGNYCTFAAHRGVYPVMAMKHRLTRMQFLAYPGDESADNVVIKGISVESRYRGRLTVAARNTDETGIEFDSDRRDLELREASPDGVSPCPPLNSDGYVVSYDGSMALLPWDERPGLKIGESLMLAPDSEYALTLYYTQTVDVGGGKTEQRDLKSRYLLKAQETSYFKDPETGAYIFRPGYVYSVKIVVYGLQEIKVSANIEGWEYGGDIVLDPMEDDGVLLE